MTTQRTSWALAREAAGLFLTAFGLLGVLVALGAIHWVAGLSAAAAGLLATGILLRPQSDAPRWAHAARVAVCIAGYGGLTGCAFALCIPLGWIGVSLAVVLVGLGLTSREHETEGAA
ncbi:hypothetical protein [Streptomyces cahuitamycinicus]|uniref:Uncharacterized protein n=1 Tax=Streptomyces cahuitamycinicus TaxID=2070367 RepID=A0A2N8TIP2_9ACTN|nr:hypothetical protein [Streptomyces cahuitamycinicus]PNG18890.1 hypothetical protein C1J00_28720 [Streptomyces cahuitamycinicus]